MQFNPNKRINAIQALEHPYFADFHDKYADTEISCEKPIQIPIDDNILYTAKIYRQKLYDDIVKLLGMQRNKEQNLEKQK